MIRVDLEQRVDAELTDYLGCQLGDRAVHGSRSLRKGITLKAVDAEVGTMGMDQPRDRYSSYSSAIAGTAHSSRHHLSLQ